MQDGDKRVANKRLLARMLWEISTTGKTRMPDGTVLILEPAEWLTLVKFIYSHIDGPPKSEIDVTSGGERIKGYVGITPDDWPGNEEA